MYFKKLYLILFVVLSGCASSPEFDTSQVELSLTPQQVIAEPEHSLGKTALWGGTILDVRNLQDSTRLEVLAYPLDSSYRPALSGKPLGRFIMQQPGFLEPASYAQGRQLTVLGRVSGSQSGQIGESSYHYPVLSAIQLHLWSTAVERNQPNIHFGVGVGISR